MDKFVYVCGEDARDTILKNGFKLLRSDENNHMYIFLNKEILKFDIRKAGFTYCFSNVLSF